MVVVAEPVVVVLEPNGKPCVVVVVVESLGPVVVVLEPNGNPCVVVEVVSSTLVVDTLSLLLPVVVVVVVKNGGKPWLVVVEVSVPSVVVVESKGPCG